MNTRKIPLFIMLLAGSVACVVTYLDHYSFHDMLVVLLEVLIIFLIVGLIVKKILDKFDIARDDSVGDEGEVVEKQADEAEDSQEAVTESGEAGVQDEEGAAVGEGNEQEQDV